jgi:hypothetical protein
MRSNVFAFVLGVSALGCFDQVSTLGLPCTENGACFDGSVCGPAGVCVDPSQADDTTTSASGDGDGDGDTTESGSSDTTESGDGDGDTTESSDTTGDGDGDTGEPVCGNGVAEGPEVCDGKDLRGETCANKDFTGGTLMCDDVCNLDLSACCHVAGHECTLGANECCGDLTCSGILSPKCNP